MRVGQLIRKWRIISDIDLRTLAKEIGIGHSTLYRIERGDTCDSRALIKLLTWLFAEPERAEGESQKPTPVKDFLLDDMLDLTPRGGGDPGATAQ